MATQISFNGVNSNNGCLCFQFDDGEGFSVKSFDKGVLVIEPEGCNIHSFAKKVAGCFEEGSNFNGLKAIEFEFRGAYVLVTAKNADPDKIVKLWNEKTKENCIKYEKEQEEYMETPEYQELQFKDEEARKFWENFVENNRNGFGFCIFSYAEYWAKFMQHYMAKHEGVTVAQIADKASHDVGVDGVIGFMNACATDILSKVWKYGEDLRKWHNKQYDYEGDGIFSPAVLNINKD